jgi:hypothetical protein
MGSVGPTDKENEVKMYKKKYCCKLHYLFETVRIRIRIRLESRIRIKRVWIRNTGIYTSQEMTVRSFQSLNAPLLLFISSAEWLRVSRAATVH